MEIRIGQIRDQTEIRVFSKVVSVIFVLLNKFLILRELTNQHNNFTKVLLRFGILIRIDSYS